MEVTVHDRKEAGKFYAILMAQSPEDERVIAKIREVIVPVEDKRLKKIENKFTLIIPLGHLLPPKSPILTAQE